MRHFRNLALAALLAVLALGGSLGAGARAQACDFEFEGGCINLPNGIPVPGRTLSVEVTLLVPVPGDVTVFYRPTGSGDYETLIPEQQGATFADSIPAAAVTVRGLDIYGTYSSAGQILTFPDVEDPAENPIHVPAYIGSFEIPLTLPARDYRMVSVAANVGTASVVDVLSDDFGAPAPARWRLVRWNPEIGEDGAYEELPEGTDSFADGAAFWLVTANGGTFDIDVAESTNPDSIPTITLLPGWNQIGNPYAFPVAWDAVRGDRAVGPLMEYVPADGTYMPTDVLQPWTGYFVHNPEGEPLALEVPDREAVGGETIQAPETSYAIHIEARSGDYSDLNNVVGFASAVASGADRLDLGEPPPPMGARLRASVVDEGRRWMRSLKPQRADGEFWDLEVAATDGLLADGPRRVTLSLAEDGTRPAGFGLYVIDRDRGTAVLVTDGAFSITLDEATPVRQLRLIAGTEAFARTGSEGAPLEPTAFALDAGYPNPFADQTTMDYRLDARGPATLEVFDLLGRRVRVLVDGEQAAGSHTAEWDGRDGAGRSVANGVYLIRLRAGDASATRRVSVLR